MKNENRKEDGFTLIEMMAVLMIIGLLMSVVAFTILGNTDKANYDKARFDIERYSQALETYKLHMKSFPEEEYGLEALVELPAGVDNAQNYSPDGYIKKLRKDPWGEPYIYLNPGDDGKPYDIISYGADKRPGGEEFDRDLSIWDPEE